MVITQEAGLPAATAPALPQSPAVTGPQPETRRSRRPCPLGPSGLLLSPDGIPPAPPRPPWLERLRVAGAALALCSGTVFGTLPRAGAAHDPGPGIPDRRARRAPAPQGSTLSVESTRGWATRCSPQFPELMAQFSSSISTRLLKA